MSKKNLPRHKSNKYFANFRVSWLDDGSRGSMNEAGRELIALFKNSDEFTADSEVSIKNKYDTKEKKVYWTRETREGKEKIVLGEISPDENFLCFLDKFFKRWYGGYRKTSYSAIKAICNFYKQNPAEFKKAANKARDLQEFIYLIGIR